MCSLPTIGLFRPLQWKNVYREAELYKAAVRVLTKPLFHWRKALGKSTDGRTLYDFAERGLRHLDAIHRALKNETFAFRPSIALTYNFNGKRRTLYIPPWDERIVDLLLYRVLNQRLHRWYSANSFAYRDRKFGLDHCQARIADLLRSSRRPVFVIKRDIRDYFASVNHDVLLKKLEGLVNPNDYLFRLLEQRIRFVYHDEEGSHTAALGIPFGCASACAIANMYLTDLDRAVEAVPGVAYFRYADDILILTDKQESALRASEVLEGGLRELRLTLKAKHQMDLVLTETPATDPRFSDAREFRHLGLLFRVGGHVALSRDKCRKIENLFRFAFRRGRRRWKRIADPQERAHALAVIAAETIENGVRNVAIVDYYLKHVEDEAQLRMLDRWLAEEVLSLVFGGHRKGHFRRISYAQLRAMGLPSLVHRRRMICNGRIESPFFVWKREKATRAFRGTVARLLRTADAAFSPSPEAAAKTRS
jgi:hypothetical protein